MLKPINLDQLNHYFETNRNGFQHTTFSDKVKDFFGDNNQQIIDLNNQMLMNQLTNENKYQWNVNGMTQAGINPLVASNNLGSMSSGGQVQQTDNLADTMSKVIGSVTNLIKAIK